MLLRSSVAKHFTKQEGCFEKQKDRCQWQGEFLQYQLWHSMEFQPKNQKMEL